MFATLCDPIYWSHKAHSVHQMFQQRILECQPCPSQRIFNPGTELWSAIATWKPFHTMVSVISWKFPLISLSSQICSLPLSNLLINPFCSDSVFGYFYRLIFEIYFQTIKLDLCLIPIINIFADLILAFFFPAGSHSTRLAYFVLFFSLFVFYCGYYYKILFEPWAAVIFMRGLCLVLLGPRALLTKDQFALNTCMLNIETTQEIWIQSIKLKSDGLWS